MKLLVKRSAYWYLVYTRIWIYIKLVPAYVELSDDDCSIPVLVGVQQMKVW